MLLLTSFHDCTLEHLKVKSLSCLCMCYSAAAKTRLTQSPSCMQSLTSKAISIMILSTAFILVCMTCNVISLAENHVDPESFEVNFSENSPGQPLLLTPLIKAGEIHKAQDRARVRNLTQVVSYSGLLTVNETHDSNLFFWFFPAAFNPSEAPLLVWLQGGPGGSSLFGLFNENGPFVIHADNSVTLRNTAWTLTHSVIYFDNPVGTGFSYTKSNAGYARDENDVARDLYEALLQFYTLFPEYTQRELYICGESYAGKYVPAISHKIHVENQKSPRIKIPLKGMAIGNGISDPISMLNYGENLYNIGLLDLNTKAHFDQEEEKARQFIKAGNYMDAFLTIDELLDGRVTPSGISYFKNVTGLHYHFNFVLSGSPPDQSYFADFIELNSTRRSIHVGNLSCDDAGGRVQKFLRNDIYQSVKPWIEDLLNAPEGYKILMYTGQLDAFVSSAQTDNFIRSLNWRGAVGFAEAQRKIWRVGKDIAGYAKSYGGFIQLVVRNAGRLVPYDQPKWSFDMINRFTAGKSF